MGYNILSIDGLGTTALELSEILKGLDINVINAKNDIEAEGHLFMRKIDFDMIVWTINTIKIKDFEIISRIRERDECRQTPIVVVSSAADREYVVNATKEGADAYITKPYNEEAACEKLCELLKARFEKPFKSRICDFITFDFSDMLERELQAASRGEYSMSVMIISVSEKENLQDVASISSGNSYEDIADTINSILKTKLRDTDSVFKYDSKSIVLLLPFSDSSGTKIVEEKIQEVLNNHTVLKNRNRDCKATAFCVSFPTDGKTSEKLLQKLEKML